MVVAYCPECKNELSKSTSERGRGYFCTECATTRRGLDALYHCSRCMRDGTLVSSGLCEDCKEAGCYPYVSICSYRRSITEPDECNEHSYVRLPFEGDIARRSWCGHTVEDPSEVGL